MCQETIKKYAIANAHISLIADLDNSGHVQGSEFCNSLYKYVVSARQKAPSLELEGELVSVGDLQNNVKAALIKSNGSEERWLYCESSAKEAVASQMKISFKKRFEDDLKLVQIALSKPRGKKLYSKYCAAPQKLDSGIRNKIGVKFSLQNGEKLWQSALPIAQISN